MIYPGITWYAATATIRTLYACKNGLQELQRPHPQNLICLLGKEMLLATVLSHYANVKS